MSSWKIANQLLLNPAKTEVIRCVSLGVSISSRRTCSYEQYVYHTGPLRQGPGSLRDVTMRTHVMAIMRSCFAALRQIRSISHSLTRHALLTLFRALLVSKVDYCNSVLTRISGHLMDRFQSVLNAAARLVFHARWSDHITPMLRELHCLRVPALIKFRLCVLTYGFLHGTTPLYLAESLHLTTGVTARCGLRSADSLTLLLPRTRRSSLDDRAFPVATPIAWNKLPSSVSTAASMPVFRRNLKTLLFRLSFC